MSKKDIEKLHHTTFEDLRQFDSEGNAFWTARKLAKILEYSEYLHFLPVIEKAKEACRNSGQLLENHFEDFLGLVEIGSGAKRNKIRTGYKVARKSVEGI